MNSYLAQFEAIIFDMDGTLIDSMPSHMEAWRLTAEQHGYPYDHEWHYAQGGVPNRQTVELINERYQLQLDPDEVARAKQQLWLDMGAEPSLIKETYELFLACHGTKPMAVGTGSARQHAIEVLEQTGLMPKLNALVTACDVKRGKPKPDTFLQAAQAMGVAPEKCVVFEDTEIGRQAAEAAGMACVMVAQSKIQWPQ